MTTRTIRTVEASNIPIQDLTEVVLDGTGIFDKFLTLHRHVLDREFIQGRIVGKEYSDTFTKTYSANLEMAISFLLSKEKQVYEIELQEAQIKKMEADAQLSLKQLEMMIAKMPHEIRLMEATADKMVADARVAELKITLGEKELLLKDKELELMEKQLLLQAQKIITEKAQTDPSVVRGGSVIDTNIKALEAQIEGMDRDAKQKIMNMMVGVFNTRINNDTGEPKPDNYMTDRALARVVKDTLESAGMTILPESSL